MQPYAKTTLLCKVKYLSQRYHILKVWYITIYTDNNFAVVKNKQYIFEILKKKPYICSTKKILSNEIIN